MQHLFFFYLLYFTLFFIYLLFKTELEVNHSTSSSIAFILANPHILKCKMTVIAEERGSFNLFCCFENPVT